MSIKKATLLLCKLSLLSIALYGVKTFCYHCTDGFTLSGVSSNRPYIPEYDSRPLDLSEKRELNLALSQPYQYHGCGGQSFIFFSQDQKYVIKLFKQRVFTVPLWVQYFPIPWVLNRYKEKMRWKRQDKIKRDFTSYKIALEELQDKTGVLFVHLNKTQNLCKKLTLTDKLHIEHEVDLDQIDFVVQKKADLVFDYIDSLMKSGQIAEAKKSVESLVYLIVDRCMQGYHDRDPNIKTNCGFLDHKAIKIDVGKLMHSDLVKNPDVMIQEVGRITAPFLKDLQTLYPELADHLKVLLDQIKVIYAHNKEDKPCAAPRF